MLLHETCVSLLSGVKLNGVGWHFILVIQNCCCTLQKKTKDHVGIDDEDDGLMAEENVAPSQ